MKLRTLLTSAIALFSLTASTLASANPVMHLTLMIDDGPSENTAAVLDILKKEGIHGNFDLIGTNVEKYPELAARIVAEGQTINDHSYAHKHPAEMTDAELWADMKGGYDAILKATGKPPYAYWPPYIEYDERMGANLKKLGLAMYQFPVIAGGEVWDRPQTPAEVKAGILASVKDGAVLLVHEWRPDTFAILEETLHELKERGCVFLPYQELADYDQSLKK